MPHTIPADRLAAVIGASPLTQPPLPFADTAFDPVISARTFEFHHGKHHKGYFDTLAKLIAGTPLAAQTLEAIIMATHADPDRRAIFNNAAQCWNHNFYWHSLSPAARTPTGELAAAITRDFGSLAAVQAELARVTTAHFGTGWGWLVMHGRTLRVISTDDADVPFTVGLVPLLTVDVWEHAYYLDWQNRRADHVAAIVAGHLDWDFAADRFAAARHLVD
jgi:Fe-Mn family superoxide dismutase